jgi:hypothetical protein
MQREKQSLARTRGDDVNLSLARLAGALELDEVLNHWYHHIPRT